MQHSLSTGTTSIDVIWFLCIAFNVVVLLWFGLAYHFSHVQTGFRIIVSSPSWQDHYIVLLLHYHFHLWKMSA